MKITDNTIDASPTKRIYWSIIADYSTNTAISELIDNALDIHTKVGGTQKVIINIDMDQEQQTITVTDNAGGVKRDDLSLLVSPGQSGNDSDEHTIGIFGVGTKRAVVALSMDIKIFSRYQNQSTYLIEIDDTWISDTSTWILQSYQVDAIPDSTTKIELNKLRFVITDESIDQLIYHLSCTYANFLAAKTIEINVNSIPIGPILYGNWAYPPEFGPREYKTLLQVDTGKTVELKITAGLVTSSNPTGEYGVYLYCNNRLIVKELKSFDVGYVAGLAGKPHPQISTARFMISITGEPKYMPWNSSKSDLNPKHRTFQAFQQWFTNIVTEFSSLSRRLSGDWDNNVFKYSSGTIKQVALQNTEVTSMRRSYLPPLPKQKKSYSDNIKQKNNAVINSKPWALGPCETSIAIEWVLKQKLDQKNRIAFILLDSTLEIAFKDYLVNDSGKQYSDTTIKTMFGNRTNVHNEVKTLVFQSNTILWQKVDYYYKLRCKLVHERVTAGISDTDISNFKAIVQLFLINLFGLDLTEN
ncbi:MAG: hypothetical protein CVV02_05905 [Firmicutes bacterium HGW-Firmicutes-7]|nr:MAG: hypothetical protein CVV02_05905 [Firmicutes bacterium HGW-Firmicutes-7]